MGHHKNSVLSNTVLTGAPSTVFWISLILGPIGSSKQHFVLIAQDRSPRLPSSSSRYRGGGRSFSTPLGPPTLNLVHPTSMPPKYDLLQTAPQGTEGRMRWVTREYVRTEQARRRSVWHRWFISAAVKLGGESRGSTKSYTVLLRHQHRGFDWRLSLHRMS
jgi:hypothetical protein